MQRVLSISLLWACLTFATSALVLHTSSRWILDSNNERVKFRCVNWPGHMETRVPEGLQHQSVDDIAAWVASAGFNCVRLTYSIDMALEPDQTVQDAFIAAAEPAGVSTDDMQALYDSAVSKNPWVSSATTRSAFAHVIDALGANDVMVMLDNHVSRASWCCGMTDGNGWWASASGYNEANSRYFNTDNWLNGLEDMATFAKSHSNVVGMSLRNELRAASGQDGNNHADWYNLCGQGASRIHSANSDLLIAVGGVGYATDLSYLYSNPFDRSAFSDKVIWEFHDYEWTFSFSNCDDFRSHIGSKAGYLLTQGQEYTGPLWLSEFGWGQASPTAAEQTYIDCLVSYMESNDAEWAYWVLAGSYYVRDQTTNSDESFGLLNSNWSGWRNDDFLSKIGNMMAVTQGP